MKRGTLSVLIAASFLPGLAFAASTKELRNWSAIPPEIIMHDVRFVMIDGSSMKGRLLRNSRDDFMVTTKKQGQMLVAHRQVAEVSATIQDPSFRDYCADALIGPIGILLSGKWYTGEMSCLESARYALLLSPILAPWTVIGLATMPVMLPVKYFKSRHTYHFKLQP